MFPRIYTLPSTVFGKSVPPFTLHTYGVLMAIAFLVGLYVASRQARKAGLDPARITDMAIYVLIAGLIGAKLLLVVVDWQTYWASPKEIFSILLSGGVFYGGLICALPVAWFYARHNALDGWQTADVLSPGVAIGQAIGRLGCFAAGCCFGRPALVPWAVTFKDSYSFRTVGTPLDTPLHPSQLYEAGVTFLIFLVLLWVSGRKKFHGQVLATYVFLYSVARFILERFRGDVVRGSVFGGALSTSQFIAILMVLATLILLPTLWKHRVAQPTPSHP